jgi:hypothetical protein
MTELSRWRITIFYRSDRGSPVEVTCDIEELDEVAEIVERGHSWDTIERIEIRLQRPAEDANLTIEAAREVELSRRIYLLKLLEIAPASTVKRVETLMRRGSSKRHPIE